MDKEGIRSDNLPSIVVYYDGQYYLYEGSKDSKAELLHFMNKLINPLVQLKSDEEVENFLDLNQEHIEKTRFFEKAPLNMTEIYKQRKTKNVSQER
jgi:hypothetical protein